MKINLIVAVSENGIIGANNGLVWELKDDLQRFKDLTTNKVIIMGRKTYESIGFALPNRLNVIVSSNPGFKPKDCLVCASLEESIEMVQGIESMEESFIIGGGQIYKQALEMDIIDKVYLTKVHASVEGDTKFKYDDTNWKLVNEEKFKVGERNHFPFTFMDYEIER